MKIQYLSDLHLEFPKHVLPDIPKLGDLLILAGDITSAHLFKKSKDSPYYPLAGAFREWMNDLVSRFDKVIYILGNHEHYRGCFTETADILAAEFPSVILLDSSFFELDEYQIYGGTLWTDFNNGDPLTKLTVQSGMNDYHVIRDHLYRKISPGVTLREHKIFLHNLREGINPEKKLIVVSHHLPSLQSIDEKYSAREHYHMNGGYASNCDDMIKEVEPLVWIHGHTHVSKDYKIGNTRILCNPRGYLLKNNTWENPEFSLEKVIKV